MQRIGNGTNNYIFLLHTHVKSTDESMYMILRLYGEGTQV